MTEATVADEKPLVRTETTHRVRIIAEVRAKVETTITVNNSDVAEYYEVEESDVDAEMVQNYAEENEDASDENDYNLQTIDDWDRLDAEIISTERKTIVPPSFVPLF